MGHKTWNRRRGKGCVEKEAWDRRHRQETWDRRRKTEDGRQLMGERRWKKGDRSWLTEDMIHKKDDQRQEM